MNGNQSKRVITPYFIFNRMKQVLNSGPNIYWHANNPSVTLRMTGPNMPSVKYIKNRPEYANAQGFNRFVYWPDYRIAGTINDIYNLFANAGVSNVEVGQLHLMTNGQVGCLEGNVQLSREVIANCSIDPLNPVHANLLSTLSREQQQSSGGFRGIHSALTQGLSQLSPSGTLFPGGLQYQQYAQNARQAIAEELSYLPPISMYPGGSEYHRNINELPDLYGRKY